MVEKINDHMVLEQILESSGVRYFNSDIRPFLVEVIRDMCPSNRALLCRLRINHFDRAIFKFRQAKEKTCIRNTKKYFEACLISAILELSFDEMESCEVE